MVETVGYTQSEAIQPHLSPTIAEVSPSIAQIPVIEYGSILRPERRMYSEQAKLTAGHELNHALATDYVPDRIEIGIKGNSLGRTIFVGEMSRESLGIAAAAGSVETAFGEAKGFGHQYYQGSDFGHIRQLFPHKSYAEVDILIHDFKEKARNSINSKIPNPRVKERVSIIIASMAQINNGTVPGDLLPDIIRIAELEVLHGVTTASATLKEAYTSIMRSDSYRSAKASGKETVIDTDVYGNTTTRIIEVQEKQRCQMCGGVNGHRVDCAQRDTVSKDEKMLLKPNRDMIPGVEYSVINTNQPLNIAG